MQATVVSTETLSPSDGVQMWLDVVCLSLVALDVKPAAPEPVRRRVAWAARLRDGVERADGGAQGNGKGDIKGPALRPRGSRRRRQHAREYRGYAHRSRRHGPGSRPGR